VSIVEDNRSTEIGAVPGAVYEQQQRRRMLIALAVLLIALILVLVKDRQFWVPSSPASESENAEPSPAVATNPAPVATPATPILTQKSAEPAPAAARPRLRHPSARPTHPISVPEAAASPVITATNRAVLPPLEVEVVAGNQHRTITPANNSVAVELQPSAPATADQGTVSAPSPDTTPVAPNAAAKVELSPGTAQILSRPVDPSYPMLAKQMKVQGAVVLQALISKTGSIQDIQVLSGPAILSAAAREAVQQWRFKPYYQAGRPVETEARITVNFTISTY